MVGMHSLLDHPPLRPQQALPRRATDTGAPQRLRQPEQRLLWRVPAEVIGGREQGSGGARQAGVQQLGLSLTLAFDPSGS